MDQMAREIGADRPYLPAHHRGGQRQHVAQHPRVEHLGGRASLDAAGQAALRRRVVAYQHGAGAHFPARMRDAQPQAVVLGADELTAVEEPAQRVERLAPDHAHRGADPVAAPQQVEVHLLGQCRAVLARATVYQTDARIRRQRHLCAHLVRQPTVVRVQEGHPSRRCGAHTGVARRGRSGIGLPHQHDLAAIAGDDARQVLAIGRAVVHHHHLTWRQRLGHHAVQCMRKRTCGPVGGNHHGIVAEIHGGRRRHVRRALKGGSA